MPSRCHSQRQNCPNIRKRKELLPSSLLLVQLTPGKRMSSGVFSKQMSRGPNWYSSRLPALHKKLIRQYLEVIQGSLKVKLHTSVTA